MEVQINQTEKGKHQRWRTRGRRGFQTQEKERWTSWNGRSFRVACELHFTVKFKFKFIRLTAYGPLRCDWHLASSLTILQGPRTYPHYLLDPHPIFPTTQISFPGGQIYQVYPHPYLKATMLTVPFAWNAFPLSIFMGCSFISFKSLPKCQFLSEDFSVLPI